jgi:hypothetical protein
MIEQLKKQIRGYLFANNNISENLRNKLSNENANINIDELISKVKKEIIPSNVSTQLVSKSTIENWNNKIKEIEKGLSNNDKDFGIKVEFEKLKNRSYKDDNEAILYINHLEDRAKTQKNKNPSFSGNVKNFAADCRKFYIDDKQKLFSFTYKDCIYDIENQISSFITAGSFQFHQYVQLAEDTYSKYKTKDKYKNDVELFPKILGIIHGICSLRKIEIPVSIITNICPKCGDKEQSGIICTKCGAYIKCPGCKHTLVKDAKICGGCGVEAAKIEGWLSQIKEADKKLSAGDYESAEVLIAPIRIKWNKNEYIVSLINGITELRSKTSEQEGLIDISISQGNYFAAQRSIDDVKRKSVLTEQLKAKERDVQKIIEQAKTLVGMGDRASAPAQKTDNYAQAVNLIADYDEAVNKLKQQNLVLTSLQCNMNGRTVCFVWEKISIPSISIEYLVFREIQPGKRKEKVAQTSATTYNDTIDIGTSYNYYVQIQFGVPGRKISVLSQGEIKSREIIATDDVTVTKSMAGNRLVSLEFTVPQNVYEVKIIRSGNGTKEFKENYKNGKFSDTDVVNDYPYTYKIVSGFKTQSLGMAESKGVNITITPAAPPSPVKLTKREGENFADISWVPPAKGVVILYMCDEKQDFADGEIIDINKVSGTAVNSVNDGKARITYGFHGIKYLYPITRHNNICVAGAPITIKSVRQVKDISYERNERKIEVRWSWDGINAVVVFSKTDDNTESNYIISKKNTPASRYTIIIPQGAKSISVGTASYFKTDEGKELLSDRVEQYFGLQVAKVGFLSVTQGGLFSKNKFKLKIQVDAPLPCDLHLLIGEGIPPMDLKNYKSYLIIPNKGLAENKPCEFSFEYLRNNKNKAMIFRLIPADLQAFKSISIVPETKQIK